jgi:hypothetical protein
MCFLTASTTMFWPERLKLESRLQLASLQFDNAFASVRFWTTRIKRWYTISSMLFSPASIHMSMHHRSRACEELVERHTCMQRWIALACLGLWRQCIIAQILLRNALRDEARSRSVTKLCLQRTTLDQYTRRRTTRLHANNAARFRARTLACTCSTNFLSDVFCTA